MFLLHKKCTWSGKAVNEKDGLGDKQIYKNAGVRKANEIQCFDFTQYVQLVQWGQTAGLIEQQSK